MPILTPSSVHVDRPLTNLTVAYAQNQANFIADRVFPVVGVSKQSDKYYIYSRENANRSGNVKKLAPRTEVERIGLSVSSDSYFADVYGLGMDFSEQDLANEDEALGIRSQGASDLINQMLIHREEQFVTNFFATGIWGTDAVGTTNFTKWDDAASTPINDVRDATRAIQLASGGFVPNTMVVGQEVRDALLDNSAILARLNGGSTVTNPALVTDAKLAEIFGVERFLVMKAVHNTAVEGATESNAFIGGKNALLCYTPSSAGMKTPAAGLTFSWNTLPGVNNMGITVESFSDDALKRQQIAEHIQVKMSYDMKVVGSELGYFFSAAVA